MNWLTEAAQPALQNVVLALISLIGAIVVAALMELRKKVLGWIAAHTSVENQKQLDSLAKQAYAYAERFYKDQGGDAKLNGAINYVMGKINLTAIGLTREDVEGAIQKAWQDYNQDRLTDLIGTAELTGFVPRQGSGSAPATPGTFISL